MDVPDPISTGDPKLLGLYSLSQLRYYIVVENPAVEIVELSEARQG